MRDLTQATHEQTVSVNAGDATLEATLFLPSQAHGIVLFAHGSGSSRHSARNRYVAKALQTGGLGTLLMDLLTAKEESLDAYGGQYRFDIPLLAARLVGAVDWLGSRDETRGLPIGCFGASTGGGAALVAAANRPDEVKAVVSRGGRPDLAGESLSRVHAPTLLVVGERDDVVIELNRRAMALMSGIVRLETVPRATHLFEEPGTLEVVAELAKAWFLEYLE